MGLQTAMTLACAALASAGLGAAALEAREADAIAVARRFRATCRGAWRGGGKSPCEDAAVLELPDGAAVVHVSVRTPRSALVAPELHAALAPAVRELAAGRRVASLLAVGAHFNHPRYRGVRAVTETERMGLLVDAFVRGSPNPAVLEAVPQHWCLPERDGLWQPLVLGPGHEDRRRCCAVSRNRTADFDGDGRDLADLRANFRNRRIADVLAAHPAVPLLRVWRGLLEMSDAHRAPNDCTHLGFEQLHFVARVVLGHLAAAPRPTHIIRT